MTIATGIDLILADIEIHNRYGNVDIGSSDSMDWQSWDNEFGRVVISVYLRHRNMVMRTPVMTTDQMREAIDRTNIVVGLESYDVAAVGLLHMETLRRVDDIDPSMRSVDLDGDEIVRQ